MPSVNLLSVKILILVVSCVSFPKCTGTSSCHFVLEWIAGESTLDPVKGKGA